MALPAAYTDSRQYLSAAVSFLREYAWVYYESNTSYLKALTLDRMPEQFRNYFLQSTNEELNNFPFVHEQLTLASIQNMPDEVTAFRHKLANLTPFMAYADIPEKHEGMTRKSAHNVKLKKQLEITTLAKHIKAYCHDTQLLVEVGAGLGYLSETLYESNPNQLILGLEADENRVQTARIRCHERLPQAAAKSLSYQQQYVNEDSGECIMQAAEALATYHGLPTFPMMSIIGLHACADLSISSIKLFLSMPQVRRIVIMPCCYHKLKMTEAEAASFVNFPLSLALKAAVGADSEGAGVAAYFNRPFLRLACQQTAARWRIMSEEEHLTHSWHMYVRALAEAVIDTDSNEMVVKLKGQSSTTPSSAVSTLTFAHLRQSFALHAKVLMPMPKCKSKPVYSTMLPWRAEHERRFNQIISKYQGTLGLQMTEALTCLQTAMQKLCENVLLYDRLCFMLETAASQRQKLSVFYEKILDEKVSPRCYALLAEKLP